MTTVPKRSDTSVAGKDAERQRAVLQVDFAKVHDVVDAPVLLPSGYRRSDVAALEGKHVWLDS